MAQKNVEIVRQVFEAAARGDTAAIFALYNPDIEWDASRTSRGEVTGRVARGHDAVMKWLREWYEVWETVDDDLEELIDAGNDTVVSIMVQRGRGRASGIEVESRLATAWTIRDGKIVRVVWFPSAHEAFAAVGLSEQGRAAETLRDRVKQIYDEWGRGNFKAGTEDYDPNITLVVRPEFADPGVYTGVDAVRTFMRSFLDPWEEIVIRAEDLQQVGDSVLAEVTQRGTGAASGLEGELSYFQLWTFRGGKLIRLECVFGADEAREAAGL
jgi:ketosteroid isomerase-like protein